MRTQMQQEAFPGEDISDRPLPEESVPGLIELLTGAHPSNRYAARDLTSEAQLIWKGNNVGQVANLTVEGAIC